MGSSPEMFFLKKKNTAKAEESHSTEIHLFFKNNHSFLPPSIASPFFYDRWIK